MQLHGRLDRVGAAVVQEAAVEAQRDERRGAPVARPRAAVTHAVGEARAHVVHEQVGVDGGVDAGERRERVVVARLERRDVTRRAPDLREERRAARVELAAARDGQHAHVVGHLVDVVEREVDAGPAVVGEPARVGRLDGAQRAGQPHVTLRGVGAEVVERADARLEAEAADERVALAKGVKARAGVRFRLEGHAVDAPLHRPARGGLLGRHALDLVVADRLKVAPPHHRRAHPARDLD